MREILFRGKRADTKEWVEGYHFMGFTGIPYILVLHDHILRMTEFYEVILETVGQFTGLLDKHGRKIFEGDIVVTCPSPLSISDGSDASKRRIVDYGVYTGMCYSAMCRKRSKVEKFYKIVGNIHDNPELLEEK